MRLGYLRWMRKLVILAALAGTLGTSATALAAPDPLRPQQYGLDIVESDAAHARATGAGAIVAVVDTGVRPTHQDLAGRLLPTKNLVAGDGPEDEDGHGTHVLGIAVANDGNGVGVSSVAPGATALPVRVLGDDGSGFTRDVAKGIDFAVEQGAHVINLSLGDTVPVGAVTGSQGEVEEAILRALARNVVVVASSGNNGAPICEQGLANDPRLLCVGAVGPDRKRSVFSSFVGPEGITAPGGNALGDDILSTFSKNERDAQSDSEYTELAGTSQAAPHVAGVAALLVQLGLRGQDVVRRLRETASDAGLPGPDSEFGAGIVNARAAVASVSPPPGPGGAPGGSTPTRVSLAGTQRFRNVLKRGIRVKCTASSAGHCTATATRADRGFAFGAKRVAAGRTVTVLARPDAAARRAIKRASRRGRKIRVTVQVAVPGLATKTRRVTLRR